MRSALRQGLFFSLLLVLTFPLVSCDSGGSNEPSWVGDWEAVSSTDDGYDEGEYWAISTEKIEIKEPSTSGCTTATFTITNIDGNTVVVTEESSGNEGLFEFEGSGDIITVREPEDEDGSIKLESVSSFPECD